MAALPQSTQSFWIDSTPETTYPQATPVSVDVAIVGGGIAGITAAKKLKAAGKTVALIESDRICRGTTGKTTAKVTSLHRAIYAELIDSKGEEKARLYGQSAQDALEQVATWVEQENINCDFSRLSAYTFGATEQDLAKIKQEYEAAKALGLPAEYVTETSLPFAIAGAVEFKNQAQFHSRKYILHLAQGLPGEGSYIFEKTHVTDVKEESSGVRVLTGKDNKGLVIHAQQALLTTNIPIADEGLFFAKAYPKRSYIIGLPIDADQGPDGMFIGIGSDDHSIRTTPYPGGKLLLLGGVGHKTGATSDTETYYQKLASYAQEKFGLTDIAYRWSSQDMVSFDKVPYVGKLTPVSHGIYVATGFGLWGMTNGTAAGMVLADQVLGIDNPYRELYDSLRPDVLISKTSLKENLDVGASWVGDRLKGLLHNAFDDVRPGEGKILTQPEGKVAAYRDDSGELHTCSAVCSHLGCIVNWNEAEKSWDCPCHGARFAISGKVMRAPAVNDLEAIKVS